MVLVYVLRHTWGFQEFGRTKRITHDEFQHGRKRRNGSRLDGGIGMSPNSIKDGVRRAVAHGFLVQEVEHRRDRGRRSYLYSLRMSNSDTWGSESDTPGVTDRTPDDQRVTPGLAEPDTRSEKDTIERNGGQIEEKEEEEREEEEPVVCPLHQVPMELHSKDGDSWYSHRLPDGSWCWSGPGDGPTQVTYRDWTPEERRWVNASLREMVT
jgi:hypothetical protein